MQMESITITITLEFHDYWLQLQLLFSKCNRLQLQITLKNNHDYFMITFDYF